MGVVLITGCSSGIGLETALAFARRGDTVCATMRTVAKSGPLQERAAGEGIEVDVLALDVTDDGSVASAVSTVRDRYGPVDVLVNNAGVSYGGPVETFPIDAARAVMETNFWGALRMIRAVLPDMRARRSGVIVNVTSTAARIPASPYSAMYASSKHALGALSESLAFEVAPFDVRVVCIVPGFFSTEIHVNGQAADEGVVGTAYEADAEWFGSFMESGVQTGAEPRGVADAICAAVDDETTPLHRTVGDDADFLVDLSRQTATFEGWTEAAVPIVEQVSGPRPAPGSTSALT